MIFFHFILRRYVFRVTVTIGSVSAFLGFDYCSFLYVAEYVYLRLVTSYRVIALHDLHWNTCVSTIVTLGCLKFICS